MKPLPTFGALLVLLGSTGLNLLAQEGAERIPEGFRTFVVTDNRYDPKSDFNRSGKFNDVVGEYGLGPVILVFSRIVPTAETEPLFQLLQKQEKLADDFKSIRLGTAIVFLNLTKDFPEDTERDSKIAAVANVSRQAKLKNIVANVAEATIEVEGQAQTAPQVKAFKIEDGDEVTVIFYNRLQVVKRWTFTKDKAMTEADIKSIEETVTKTLAKPKKK
jgi:hypothetical protein